jgi:hypothetical protein
MSATIDIRVLGALPDESETRPSQWMSAVELAVLLDVDPDIARATLGPRSAAPRARGGDRRPSRAVLADRRWRGRFGSLRDGAIGALAGT